MSKKQKYTLDEAQEKLEHYCALQERSHFQITKKLHSWGIYGEAAEDILTHLIQENYLSESRFAEAYVKGKFRMNKWGKIKIMQGLKQHGVSEYNIHQATEVIDDEAYHNTLKKLAQQKSSTLPSDLNAFEKKHKISNYLAQKGYSYADIQPILDDIAFQKEDEA